MWRCAVLLAAFLAPAFADDESDRHTKMLIQQLGDSSFEVREQATNQLQKLGEPIRAMVERAEKEETDAEIRTRAAAILRELDAARNRARQMHVVGVYQASGEHFKLIEPWGRGVDWEGLSAEIVQAGKREEPSPGKRIWEFLTADAQSIAEDEALLKEVNAFSRRRGEERPDRRALMAARTLTARFTEVLIREDFYEQKAFAELVLPKDVTELLKLKKRTPLELRILNRRLFELAFPAAVRQEAFTLESCTVPVRVSATREPITLVLCSYESVHWKITLDEGAKVEKVLVGGYYVSEAFGVDAPISYYLYDAPERRKEEPRYFYAYQNKDQEYSKLEGTLRQLTGKEISTFQGGYDPPKPGFVVPAQDRPKVGLQVALNDKETKATEEILKIGGKVGDSAPKNIGLPREELRSDLLHLSWCKNPDKALELAQDLPPVRSLYLDFCSVSEAGLTHIGNFDQLQYLSLREAKVPGAALKHLGRCKELEHLVLRDTMADDETAEHLSKLPKLKHLVLQNTAITDKGMESLASLEGLESLSLNHTRITTKGLENLRKLGRLASIDLDGIPIGDEGVETLVQLKSLVALRLNVCEITDAGLKQLASMEKLKVLYLAGNPISPEGYAALRDAPKLSQLYLAKDLTVEQLAAVQKALPKIEVQYITRD